MDLNLYFRVLWRFKLLVLAGVLLAAALAFLSFAKVSFANGTSPKVSYRKPQYWQSQAAIFVTQRGYPWGRSIFPPVPTGVTGAYTSPYADSGRFAYLASFYAQLATSDAVQALIRKSGPVRGTISAAPGYDQRTTNYLPFVYVAATSTREAWAVGLANRAAATIRDVVKRQQESADIPPKQRVVLQVFSKAQRAQIVQPRKKTVPIVIFLTVLLVTIGLAFILENLRPRIRKVEGFAELERPAPTSTPESERTAAARSGVMV